MIPKKLMYYHFGAFGIFTLSLICGLISLNSSEIFPNFDHQQMKKLKLSTETIVVFLVAISEFPLINILSKLVAVGEKEV